MEREIKRRSFLKNLFSLSAFIAGSHISLKMAKSCGIGRISQTTALGMGISGSRIKKIAVEEHARPSGGRDTLLVLEDGQALCVGPGYN